MEAEKTKQTKSEMQAQILKHYGFAHQIMKLKEELLELAAECEWVSEMGHFGIDFFEEFADAKNLIEQIESTMKSGDKRIVEQIQIKKCEREISRIEELKNKE